MIIETENGQVRNYLTVLVEYLTDYNNASTSNIV